MSQQIHTNEKRKATYHFGVLFLIFVSIASCLIGWSISNYYHSTHAKSTTEESNTSGERKILFYQSPMHPWIKSDKPGKCTICGMALAPVYEGDTTANTNADYIKLTDISTAIVGVESTPATIEPLTRTLRVSGVISDDETQHRILSARVAGRIEVLHVNQVGVEVKQNQPLAVIYSPEFLTMQRLYLENLVIYNSGTGAVTKSDLYSSREKLLALGMFEEDIKQLVATGKTESNLIIRSLADGTVISRKVYEGQYVNPNDELFETGNFDSLWFIFDAYESSLPLLKLNQSVTVSLPSFTNETVTAPITFIDPSLNESTRTARVRVVLPNPQRRILHRQTATGIVHIETEPVLIIPRTAVLYTYKNPVAYVDLGDNNFQLRNIELGTIGDKHVEIKNGIKEGEKVITQAALIIDSQSQLAHIGSNQTQNSTQENNTNQHEKNNDNNTTKLTTPTKLQDDLVKIMIQATDALSADNLTDYQKHLPALIEAINKTTGEVRDILLPLADKLTAGENLKQARQPFEPFSNSFADIIRTQPQNERQAKIFQCPMSPVLGTARWIQHDNEKPRNPFFGSEMLNCGDEIQ
jgi:Cu(I)/Ag(I) efflux system membrane fusion protein